MGDLIHASAVFHFVLGEGPGPSSQADHSTMGKQDAAPGGGGCAREPVSKTHTVARRLLRALFLSVRLGAVDRALGFTGWTLGLASRGRWSEVCRLDRKKVSK